MTLEELIAELGRFQAAGGRVRTVPVEDPNFVLAVQDSLGLRFSPEFVSFYQAYSYVQIGSYEFRAIRFLAELYKEQQVAKQLPTRHYFPVLVDHSDGCYYLVCGGRNSTPGRVLHYESIARLDEVGESYADFFALVMALIEKAAAFLGS